MFFTDFPVSPITLTSEQLIDLAKLQHSGDLEDSIDVVNYLSLRSQYDIDHESAIAFITHFGDDELDNQHLHAALTAGTTVEEMKLAYEHFDQTLKKTWVPTFMNLYLVKRAGGYKHQLAINALTKS